MNAELSLIDHGIQSLNSLQLSRNLVHINLHCNNIQKIEGLQHLSNLKSLDLSSNLIAEITGLDGLQNLKSLNLSCNKIDAVKNIENLRKLERLDISYNQIVNLSGLENIRPSSHILKYIDLHGNNISSLSHVINCLTNCRSLEVLIFKDENDGNPICELPGYKPNIWAQLSNLKTLDGEDRHGNAVSPDENFQNIVPGLEDYLEWLVESNQSTTSKESSPQLDVKTPKIDEVLQMFNKKRTSLEKDLRGNKSDAGTKLMTDRLGALERQITSLMQMQMDRQRAEEEDRTATAPTTSSETTQLEHQPVKNRSCKARSDRMRTQNKTQGKQNATRGTTVGRGTKKASSFIPKATRTVRDPKEDESALMLMQELEEERERRWKAEQAARKLVNAVKEIQEKLVEEQKIQEVAITSSTRLKSALTQEKDTRISLEKALQGKEKENAELSNQLVSLRESEAAAKEMVKSLEETVRNSEKERMKDQAFKEKKLQETHYKAAASLRETELLRANVQNLKVQVSQLQELLASREQDHKEKLASMVAIDGKEMRDTVEREIAKQEGRYAQLIQQFNERLEMRNREYAALEDEFRAGLQIEANRFSELQDAYSQLVNESSEVKRSFQLIKQKESKATSLVTELTSMVKEQKGRLSEVSKSKQEMQVEFKERIQNLESQLDVSRKQLSRMETFRQEKDKLLAQSKAQESVIEGLRTERKLWGHELAQQGASLAHDRGRLESQIEALSLKIKQLTQKENEQLDSLKIKTKLVEDQTDTIKKLKQELVDCKIESKRVNDEAVADRRNLEEDLEEERKNLLEMQEAVELLTNRKEELKSQLAKSNKDLEKNQEESKNMKKNWEERSSLIGQLEEKVVKMKDNFEGKEKKLRDERDASLKAANSALEKARSCDDAFRRQLEEMQREHELEKRRLVAGKNDELEKAKQRINEVEDEMRLLLEETAISKKNLELKVKQLSKAFLDVQQDLAN